MKLSMIETEYTLIKKIKERNFTVAVIGLGYVGLPLLLAFSKCNFRTIGIDIDDEKLESLKNETSYLKHISSQTIREEFTKSINQLSSNYSKVKEADAIILCVPTPLTKQREPDLKYIINTCQEIAPHLREHQLIVLESTTYPGTTEEYIKPICETFSGLKSGENLFISYSPEREDPGNLKYSTTSIPKVVGADGKTALNIAQALYQEVIVDTIPVSNLKTAEAVKLLENIFRSVNIALVNELKVVFQEMGININEVIDAAKTKPFGYMPFYPGPGLGGHCIPIDPFYLTWKAREFGLNTRFIELAGEINTKMPEYVLKRTQEALNEKCKPLYNASILCIGIAYKPNVADTRESPTFEIMELLDKQHAIVDFYDPYISEITLKREHPKWVGKQSIEWSKSVISSYDAIIIVTNHDSINYQELLNWNETIIDTRNATKNLEKQSPNHVWMA
jgi:UDP-N-acetyl-D-glucosamine dehydrogenase